MYSSILSTFFGYFICIGQQERVVKKKRTKSLSDESRVILSLDPSSRKMPGHIREFNRLKPHSSHDLVFKIWPNNKTEATLRVFLSLIVSYLQPNLNGYHQNINIKKHQIQDLTFD